MCQALTVIHAHRVRLVSQDDTCLVVRPAVRRRRPDQHGGDRTLGVWYKILDHRMLDQNDLNGLGLDYWDQYTGNPPLALYNEYTGVGLLPLLNKSINRNFAPPADDWSGTKLKIALVL